jgi:uncharacterized membrane protein
MSRSIRYASGGFALGAAIAYFWDPARGRLRRSQIRDESLKVLRKERDLFGRAARDASNRAYGIVERTLHPVEAAAPDEVVAERVRARLGHVVSHAHAIEVSVRDGHVTLRGPILAAEAEEALREVAKVPGVRGVTDELERHATSDSVPALQGESTKRGREMWTPAKRGAAITGGLALALWGLARRGPLHTAATLAGSALAVRGALNMPFPRMLGLENGPEGIVVHKTLTVHAPIEQVFDLWSKFENFPRFMEHVRAVHVHDDKHQRSTWTIEGPGGAPITFDAELTRFEPPHLIAWQTLPGQRIEHAGRVRFDPAEDGTRLDICMTYRPPAGVIGHAIAHLLGWDPKTRIDDDLVRMKTLLELGRTRAHGERIELADMH